MNRRIAALSATLLAFVVTTTYAQDKVYKEPKDVFDAAKAAAKKGNYKDFHATLTPDSADLMTGQLALVGVVMKGFADFDKTGKAEKQMEPLFKALEKHGLTKAVLGKMKPLNPKADQKEQMKALKELIKPIKKQPEFVDDMMAAMKKINPKGGGLDEIANDKLEDVKVTGDKATGNAVGKRAGKDSKTPLQFEKIKGKGWRIVLPQPKAKTDVDD